MKDIINEKIRFSKEDLASDELINFYNQLNDYIKKKFKK